MNTIKIIGTDLYQWEIGRQLQILPLRNMKVDIVHFSNPGDSEALSVEPKEINGMIIADIPNILLQSGENLVVHTVNVSNEQVETLRECVLGVRKRPKPTDYVYTETETLGYRSLEKRIDEIEKNGVSDEQVERAVKAYLDEHPIDSGVQFETDNTLILKDGILSVNTTDQMEQDNTLPMTSAGVYATVGNIEALLKTI